MNPNSPGLPVGKPISRWLSLVLWHALLAALLVCPASASSLPFTTAQRAAFARLVQADPEAVKLYRKFQGLADASLEEAPRPVKRITTAGELASAPAKVASRLALKDMEKIQALGFAYVATSKVAYGNAAKRMILGWAEINEPTGQPIDETKLEPLFIAYGLTRPVFSAEEKKRTELWLRSIAQHEGDAVLPNSVTASNNWNSHRLKIIGLIGFLLEDQILMDRTRRGFERQIQSNLQPDGSSLDFHERDALHYHCYDLEPLLTLAIAAHQRGLEWYDYHAPNGASLRQAVQFLIPFCEGTATHAEWVHSKVAFDRVRAEAGESQFAVGAKFNPRDGMRVLALASFFDRRLDPLIAKLAGREGSAKFPVWQSVLNGVLRQ